MRLLRRVEERMVKGKGIGDRKGGDEEEKISSEEVRIAERIEKLKDVKRQEWMESRMRCGGMRKGGR